MISWTPPSPGDPRDAAAVNAIWSAIAAESAAIPGADWRLEGLDRRVIAKAASPYRAFNNVGLSGPAGPFVNTGFAIQTISGSPFQSGAFVVPSDGQVVIDAGFEMTDSVNRGVEGGYFVEARLVIYDGSTTTAFPFTYARTGFDDGTGALPQPGLNTRMRLRLRLDGATYGGSYNYAAVETRIGSVSWSGTPPATGYYMRRAQMFGITYPRGT